ncbi:unnamed protein product [Linum trigynum]|uniref:Trihelix transcription factor GT-1 n=1 Tax=Linum trigynum TaxID=586398 RepID=A0AAV2GT76_9ROSI
MYLSDKPRAIDFYKEELPPRAALGDNMIIEVVSPNGDLQPLPQQQQHNNPPPPPPQQPPQPQQMILGDSSGEIDLLFNTSKSNMHLWEQILLKMREKGFDRSPTMCTGKWRNLLNEFKKAKHQEKGRSGGSAKMSYYKEIDEILKDKGKSSQPYKSTTPTSKVDSFMQFANKGFEDTSLSFGPVEASGRPTLNLERRLDSDGHPLAITAANVVAASGVPPWNWREAPGSGADNQSYGRRVITVKYGDYLRRIGIDGTADAIKDAIRSGFRLRTKRAFWLEDEDQVIRSLGRDMTLGNYTLHLDEGLGIKNVDRMDDLRPRALYRGVN